MGSSVKENMGQLHIVTGRITYLSGVPSLTTNDDSASVTDTAEGDVRIPYDAFLTPPQIFCSALKGTHSATTHNNVALEQISITNADFRWLEHVDGSASTSPDPADDEPASDTD